MHNYVIDTNKVLGKGSFGTVHKGRYDGMNVAIKQIETSCVLMLSQELLALNHFKNTNTPYVVKLLDAFMEKTQDTYKISIVCELASMDLCAAKKQLSINDSIRYARNLMEAINYVHACGIVHRDLKPANLFIRNNQLILGDFGHSKCFSDNIYSILDTTEVYNEPTPTKPTKAANDAAAEHVSFTDGNYICTLWYRAPELLLSNHHTKAVDMWSVGCIVAELFLMTPLFQSKNENELLTNIIDMIGPPTETHTQYYSRSHLDNARWDIVDSAQSSLKIKTIEFLIRDKVKTSLDATKIDSLLRVLTATLTWCPYGRMTAKQALKESFFTPTHPLPDPRPASPLHEDTCVALENISSFRSIMHLI